MEGPPSGVEAIPSQTFHLVTCSYSCFKKGNYSDTYSDNSWDYLGC